MAPPADAAPVPSASLPVRLLFAASLPFAGIALCAPWARLGWFPDLCLHLSHLTVLALLPGLIAVRRRPRQAAFLGVALLCGAWPWLLAAYTPRAPLADARGMRVATLNLYDFNTQRSATLAAVLALDADVLALQEVLPADEAVLRARWPHAVWSHDRELLSSALLSRTPLRDTRIHDLDGFALIEAVTDTDHGPLRIWVVHLASPKWPARAAVRAGQLRTLAGLVGSGSEAVLVLGDFNLSAAAPAWRDFCSRTGLLRPNGPGPATWPRWLGPCGIDLDHCAGRGIACTPLDTIAVPGSDHRGLRAQVTVR